MQKGEKGYRGMLDVPDVAEGAYFHGREVFLVFFNVHTAASFSLRFCFKENIDKPAEV